jgi:hypothetical protein
MVKIHGLRCTEGKNIKKLDTEVMIIIARQLVVMMLKFYHSFFFIVSICIYCAPEIQRDCRQKGIRVRREQHFCHQSIGR